MVRIQATYDDVLRVGERYLDEVPGPIEIGEVIRTDELWVYFSGSVQGRPCEIRIEAIRNDFLRGVDQMDGYASTLVGLLLEHKDLAV